ncbi:MAG: BamA/TamA family outer membrane protein [Endozoicomonas sp. (ex Botrylloides leachii)]|nr:BamA/TamA family outer membrane protein [Endozoicomonas sp. (ex Botrylloides leachii)]
MFIRYLFSLVLLLFFLPEIAFAVSLYDPIDGKLDMGEYLAENAYGFLPMPMIITEPAVGYGIGFNALFLHESEQKKEKRKRLAMKSINGGAQLLTPSISLVGGLKTDNGTWMAYGAHRQVWGDDKIRYLIAGGYGNVNMNFYTPYSKNKNDRIELNMEGQGLIQNLQFRIKNSHFFIGLGQKFFSSDIKLANGAASTKLIGTHNIANLSPTISGLGFVGSYDTRNNVFNPTNGAEYKAEYIWYRDTIGSDYNYTSTEIIGSHYIPISSKWLLALRWQYNAVFANTLLPPPAYPDIHMRGIPRNRYQGSASSAVQAQINYNITPRWLIDTFGGIGSAAKKTGDLYSHNDHSAYGIGFRYLIARRYGINMGVDVAKSDDDQAIYLNLGTGW